MVERDWRELIQLEQLLAVPEVRERIARHAAASRKQPSAEEFLRHTDELLLAGLASLPALSLLPGTSFLELGAIVQPLGKELGIKTGKARSETLAQPAGAVIVAALCSLAAHGQTLRSVRQFDDGCFLEAVLPSDMWSWEGALHVLIRQTAAGTQVDAGTLIEGQMFDWGKSKRCLKALFNDLAAISSASTA